MCVCYACAHVSAPTSRALSLGVDRVRFGSQAFNTASVFNANIGAWNTARVTDFSMVCADFGRRRAPRPMRSAGVRCGAAVVRSGIADARKYCMYHR